MSASFKPLPSPQSRFSFGTRTFVKRMTPFSMPRMPMNSSRCGTSTPAQLVSTMNAVIGPGLPSRPGVRAITTISSAIGPFVIHSFSPFRIQAEPSLVGVAVVVMRAGSEPTSISVSANAVIAPLAQRGRKRCFCSGVPNILTGPGTPIDWCAESSATSGLLTVETSDMARQYVYCDNSRPPYSRGILMPNAPSSRRPWIVASGMRASRSIFSASTLSRTNRSSLDRNTSARCCSSASGSGQGWMSERSSLPRNSSRTNDGASQVVSRAPSATARASVSLTCGLCVSLMDVLRAGAALRRPGRHAH